MTDKQDRETDIAYLDETLKRARELRRCYEVALRRARVMLVQELLLRRLPGPRC